MKKAIYLFILLCAVLFTSCENFLNGSDVLEQLDDMIDEANAKTFTIIVSSDNPEGTFLSSGDKMCKLGYTIDVQFTVKRDVYIYKGLKAVNKSNTEESLNDCVEFEEIDKDDQRGVYKTAIRLVKESDDILILPECELVPNVVKEDCKPENTENGVEQDSTIAIVFNKPVTMSEFFTPVITDSAGQNLIDYFDEYSMSADNTVLYIPTNKTKNILDPNGTVAQKDVIVKVDLSDVTDENGNKGNGVYQHKYRVNKNRDNIKPVLTASNLFTTDDTESEYYKELSDKAFEDWTNEGTDNGDFGAHHIGGAVYVEVEGYDNESGIAGLVVKEKLLKYTDGADGDGQVFTERLVCDENEETKKYCASYEIKTKYDGIVELEFFVQDYADNLSEVSKKYYVIKDTMVDSGVVKFAQELGQFPDTYEGWKANIPVVDGDNQTVVLTLSDNAKDLYYGNYSTAFDLTAFWGYSEDSITEPVTKTDDGKYTFIRDVDRFVYIKLVCTDSLGNEKEIIKRMAPRAEAALEKPDAFSFPNLSIGNIKALLVQCNILADSTISAKNYCARIYRFYDQQDNSKYSEVISYNEFSLPVEYSFDTFIAGAYRQIDASKKPLCDVEIYLTTTIGNFPSPMSKNYIKTSIVGWNNVNGPGAGVTAEYDAVDYTEPQTSSMSKEGTDIIYSFGPSGRPYIKDNFKLIATPIKSSGCYKVIIDDYLTDAGKAAGVTCSFYAVGFYLKNYEVDGQMIMNFVYNPMFSARSKTPELLLNSPQTYKIFIEANDPSTNITYMPYDSTLSRITTDEWGNTYFNYDFTSEPQSCSFYVNSAATTTNHLALTEDLTPPYMAVYSDPFTYPGYYSIGAPTDYSYNEEDGEQIVNLYKNSRGNYELDYYIIPNASNNIKYIPTYTIDELETCYTAYKKVAEYKVDLNAFNQKITIPYGDIKEGFYTISFITKDIYGNTSVSTYPFVNTVLGDLPYNLEEGEEWVEDVNGQGRLQRYYQFTIDDTKRSEIAIKQINGVTKSTINALLVAPNRYGEDDWGWYEGTDERINYTMLKNLCYDNQTSNYTFNHKIIKVNENQPVPGALNCPWCRLSAYYGFEESDTALGKGFYTTEYLYIGEDKNCNMKNCVEGLNGIQIFSDNTVMVHTMFSPAKITESKYETDALKKWENKGAETGLMIYSRVQDDSEYFIKNYDASKLNDIPVGCWYTTIIRFADGTTVMTDIKQKY